VILWDGGNNDLPFYARVLKVGKPMVRVAYALAEQQPGVLARLVQAAVATPAAALRG
jgi:predicted GTPase